MTCGTNVHGNIKRLTPIKAIRAKCLDCSAGSQLEVKECIIDDCSLYPYRMGRNPNITRAKGDTDALRKARSRKKSLQ